MSDELLLLRRLSDMGRQIVSSWRAKLLYQKHEDPFLDEKKVKKRLKKLENNKLITPLRKGSNSLWQASSPYINQSNNIYELANEAYPVGVLSYSTALEVLKLTDQRSHNIHVCLPNISISSLLEIDDSLRKHILPPDTELNDWQMNEAPGNANINNIWDHTIKAHSIKSDWIFGTEIRDIEGVRVKTFSLERTLIDGLKNPKYCGGLNEVFKAWVRALDDIDMNTLVKFVELYDITILYQRVGFVSKMLGLYHPKFEAWKENKAPRGGSRLLNPHKEYANSYDEEWNISINHPVSILENKDADYS